MTDSKPFDTGDTGRALGADDANPYAAPRCDSQSSVRDLQVGEGPWRDGPLLIMLKEEALPPRCVKCNEPAEYVLKRTLNWLPPFTYLFLPTCLGFLIASVVFGHAAEVYVGLCDVHRFQRRIAVLVKWILWLTAIGLIWVGVSVEHEHKGLLLVGLLTVVVALFYGFLGARIVAPKRIDGEFAWLKGVCAAYLAELPNWIAPDRDR